MPMLTQNPALQDDRRREEDGFAIRQLLDADVLQLGRVLIASVREHLGNRYVASPRRRMQDLLKQPLLIRNDYRRGPRAKRIVEDTDAFSDGFPVNNEIRRDRDSVDLKQSAM